MMLISLGFDDSLRSQFSRITGLVVDVNLIPRVLLNHQYALPVEGQGQARRYADLMPRRGEKSRRVQLPQGVDAMDQRLDHLAVGSVSPTADRPQVLAGSRPG